jgi:hypothetical protein
MSGRTLLYAAALSSLTLSSHAEAGQDGVAGPNATTGMGNPAPAPAAVGAPMDSTPLPFAKGQDQVLKAAIAHQLRDPASTQFENVRLYASQGHRFVCGRLNSKNGYGGYSGFQPFYLAIGDDGAPGQLLIWSPNPAIYVWLDTNYPRCAPQR